MKNNNPDYRNVVYGSLNDPFVQQRLHAVANVNNKKQTIKPRFSVLAVETIKVASAFGAINKEITTTKELQPLNPQEIKSSLEERLDNELKQTLGNVIVPVDDKRLAKAKGIRTVLSSLWSTHINKTSSEYDQYIDGLPNDEHGATKNNNAGDSGVRIKFR